MKNFTPELIAKAKTAKTAEELLELAKASNVELTAEEAQTYFTQLNAKGVVADDELDAVAGGGCGVGVGSHVKFIDGTKCPKCKCTTGTVTSHRVTVGYANAVICDHCGTTIVNSVKASQVEPA